MNKLIYGLCRSCGINFETAKSLLDENKLKQSLADYNEKQARIKAEREERERLEEEEQKKKAAAKRAKLKKVTIITTSIVALIITVIVVITTLILPNMRYNEAVDLFDSGQYNEAISAFVALGGFRDSEEIIVEAREKIAAERERSAAELAAQEAAELERIREEHYLQGLDLFNAGDFEGAIKAFLASNDWHDSEQKIIQSHYMIGLHYLNTGQYTEAVKIFEELNEYEDSVQLHIESLYQVAREILEQATLTTIIEAQIILSNLGNYRDSVVLLGESQYIRANLLAEESSYSEAIRILERLDTDRAQQLIIEFSYAWALELIEPPGRSATVSEVERAKELFIALEGFMESNEMIALCDIALMWQGGWVANGNIVRPVIHTLVFDVFRQRVHTFSDNYHLQYEVTFTRNTAEFIYAQERIRCVVDNNTLTWFDGAGGGRSITFAREADLYVYLR